MPSKNVLEKKQQQVNELVEQLKDAQSIVFADFKGLTVAQETEMRAAFRKEGLTYQVVKNSLSSRALEKLGLEPDEELLKGPTAIAYSTEDVVLAPRLVQKYCDEFKKMEIKGGIVNGEMSTLDTIKALSSIPTTETLYGQLCFMLMYPLTALAQVSSKIAEKGEEQGVEAVADIRTDEPADGASDTDE